MRNYISQYHKLITILIMAASGYDVICTTSIHRSKVLCLLLHIYGLYN